MPEIGGTGIENFSGYITEDYNSSLRFPESVEVFDKMRKSDATIAAGLSSCKTPILSAKYDVEPASQDKRDVEIAEFVKWQFFEEIVWRDFLYHILLMFDFGFMVFEKVFTQKDKEEKTFIIYSKMAPRLPKSIERWLTENEKPGITQIAVKSDNKKKSSEETISIPEAKLFKIAYQQEGDNYQGVSILRAAYQHWWFKSNLYKIQAISAEKNGVGIPTATRTVEGTSTAEENAELKKSLKNVRANSKAFMKVPYGWDFKISTPEGSGQFDFQPAINHHDEEELLALLSKFLATGRSSGGYAQSKNETDFLSQAMEGNINSILEKINRDPVRKIVDMNYDKVDKYPKIIVTQIGKVDANTFSVAVQRLTQSGLDVSDFESQKRMRIVAGLPEIDQDEFEKRQEEKQKQVVPNPITPEPAKSQKKDNPDDKEVKKEKKEEVVEKENEKIKEVEEKDVVKNSKKKTLADDSGFSRPLTLAEKNGNMKKLKNFWDKTQSKLKSIFIKSGNSQIDAIEKELLKGKIDKKTRVRIAKIFEESTKNELISAFDFGKKQGMKEAGADLSKVPKTPPEKNLAIKTTANTAAKKQHNDIQDTFRLTIADQLNKGVSEEAAIAIAAAQAEKLINKQSETFASVNTAGQINSGKETSFTNFADLIWGYQYSAILDDRTTNICLSLDGRVTKSLKQMPIPPLHYNCRSQIVAISKEQTIKPEVNPPPKSVVDKVGDSFPQTVQPATPTNVKGSPAKKQIEKNKDS